MGTSSRIHSLPFQEAVFTHQTCNHHHFILHFGRLYGGQKIETSHCTTPKRDIFRWVWALRKLNKCHKKWRSTSVLSGKKLSYWLKTWVQTQGWLWIPSSTLTDFKVHRYIKRTCAQPFTTWWLMRWSFLPSWWKYFWRVNIHNANWCILREHIYSWLLRCHCRLRWQM